MNNALPEQQKSYIAPRCNLRKIDPDPVMIKHKRRFAVLLLVLVLVLSGAIGNIIDRLFRGYVVDFFEFTFFEWPVFNVADIYVVVGVILLALMLIFVVKEEDLDFKKKKDE